jgi:Raf kinase inhibitor-like YbhB/YbcL family protein
VVSEGCGYAAPVKRLSLVSCVVLAIGCGGGDSSETPDGPGGSDGPATSDAPADTATVAFAITSPAFTQGSAIPEEISCNGADTSPQLDWVGAPAGTLSFAIVFTDLTIDFIHSVIYDIPANLTGLPAGVDKDFAPADVPGAHQTKNFRGGSNFGYAGPCPGSAHQYEFRLYALDVAVLPGATMTTDRGTATTLIEEHDLESTALSGTYTP